MQARSLRWSARFALVLAPLAALVFLEGSARAQPDIDRSSPTAAAQPSLDGAPADWQAEAARTLVSIQDALRRQEAPPQTLSDLVVEFGRPIVVVAIYLVGLLVLLWAWSHGLRLFPREATLVSFDDLSVPRSERPDKSRMLTQSILDLLQNPRPVQMSDLQMDIMPGVDEPGFGGLQPAITMVSVLEYEPSDNPMKIGLVEFSMRDLLAFISPYFTRPNKQYLEGWLTEENGGVDAGARLLDRTGTPVLRPRQQEQPGVPQTDDPHVHSVERTGSTEKPRDRYEWRVRRVGADARVEAVADLAAQILVDTGNSTLTNNWQSFRSFHEALKLRAGQRPDGHSDALAEARGHLERAVAHDPSNWIARFSLALTLSRDDEADVALEHFRILEEVVSRAWDVVATIPRDSPAYQRLRTERPTFFSAVNHLEDYPECAFLILYNKAIALESAKASRPAEVPDVARLEQASNIFAQIARLDEDRTPQLGHPYPSIAKDGRLSERSRVELSLYALSAQADLLADAPECLRTPPGLDRNLSRADQIEVLLRKVEDRCQTKKEEHWRSLQTARAVTLTAHASALARDGRPDHAHNALQTALAAEPRFIKAALRLADLYMSPPHAWADWSLRAQSLLTRVLEISPSCEHARLLLARLYAHPSVDRATDAAELLRGLADNSKAQLQRAELCLSSGAQHMEAVDCLRQYIALSGTMDDAANDLLNTLLAREVSDRTSPDQRWSKLAKVLLQIEPNAGRLHAERIRGAVQRLRGRIGDVQFS